ncbi:MAG: nucleotidyltransferase domain-containing protein [Calditrichota bacterium]
MVEKQILNIVRKYLASLPDYGIHPTFGVIFGSFARGTTNNWSDLDVVVIAPEFDNNPILPLWKKLWHATKGMDNRIEPIPCGVKEWREGSPQSIIETARKEGIEITL